MSEVIGGKIDSNATVKGGEIYASSATLSGGQLSIPTPEIKVDPYTGAYSVVPSEEAQTLETNGLRMTEDVEISPIPSQYIVPSGTKQITSNGTHDVTEYASAEVNVPVPPQYIIPSGDIALRSNGSFNVAQYETASVSVPWNYIGEEAELVNTIYPKTATALKNTLYNGWTPSTTAKAIVTTQSLTAFSADFTQYEYMIRWSFCFVPAYTTGATMKVQVIRESAEIWQAIFKRPSTLANIQNDNWNGNACMTFFQPALLAYYKSDGSITYTWAASYGIYPSATAATFGNSTNDVTNVTPKTPAINARCSTTYFATARAAELDQDNSKFYLTGRLYRIKKKGAARTMLENMVDVYNDPVNS